MKTKSTKQNRGFTIIEVMIVLGIAGLILAIVLLAVPALQRSQRNNARRSDAVHYGGLVSDFVSNHGGTMPTTANGFVTTNETFSQLKSYTIVPGKDTSAATTANAVINTDASCDSTTNVVSSPQNGSFAISFDVEAPGGPTLVCIPS